MFSFEWSARGKIRVRSELYSVREWAPPRAGKLLLGERNQGADGEEGLAPRGSFREKLGFGMMRDARVVHRLAGSAAHPTRLSLKTDRFVKFFTTDDAPDAPTVCGWMIKEKTCMTRVRVSLSLKSSE